VPTSPPSETPPSIPTGVPTGEGELPNTGAPLVAIGAVGGSLLGFGLVILIGGMVVGNLRKRGN
jgi:hypothetical protein